MIDILLVSVALVGLIVGSITDFQKREVADWINFSLLFAGIGIRLLTSVHTGMWVFVISGVLGAAFAFVFSLLMFYTGQWGGGDAKMLMGLGALHGTYSPILFMPTFPDNWFFSFLPFTAPEGLTYFFIPLLVVNIFLFGALYGIIWSLIHIAFVPKKFITAYKKQYKALTSKKKKYTIYVLLIFLLLLFFILPQSIRVIPLSFAVLISLWQVLSPLSKAIESATMVRRVLPSVLGEGEWVLETITQKGTLICEKGMTLTSDHLKKISSTKEKTYSVRRGFGKKDVVLSKIRDTDTFTKSYSFNGKRISVGPLSLDEKMHVMHTVIQEQSKYYAVTRNGKSIKLHQSLLKEDDVLDEPLYKTRLVMISEKNLGIDRYQIALLQKYHNKPITIKVGLPFIPAFLGGYILTLIWGDVITRVIHFLLF